MNVCRLLALLSLLFLLTGCPSDLIEVTVTDCSANHLNLQLSQGRNFYSGLHAPASVYRAWFYGDTKQTSDLWSIESTEYTDKHLSTLTYGIIPDGFKGTPAKPLHPGILVHIGIKGIDKHSLNVTICK